MCWDDIPEEATLRNLLTGTPTRLESQFRLTYNMILNLLRVEDLKVSCPEECVQLLTMVVRFLYASLFNPLCLSHADVYMVECCCIPSILLTLLFCDDGFQIRLFASCLSQAVC